MTASRGIGRGDVVRLRAAPRCGARTRRGSSCAAPAVRRHGEGPVHGRRRCRMHGGAAGSGAPRGNRNALKDGFYTAAARIRRRAMNAFIREMAAAVARLEAAEVGGDVAATVDPNTIVIPALCRDPDGENRLTGPRRGLALDLIRGPG